MVTGGLGPFVDAFATVSFLRLFVLSSLMAGLASSLMLSLYLALSEYARMGVLSKGGLLALPALAAALAGAALGLPDILIVLAGVLFGAGSTLLAGTWASLLVRLSLEDLVTVLSCGFLAADALILCLLLAQPSFLAWLLFVAIGFASIGVPLQLSMARDEDGAEVPVPHVSDEGSSRRIDPGGLLRRNGFLLFGTLLCVYILACTESALLGGLPISNDPGIEGIGGLLVASALAVALFWIVGHRLDSTLSLDIVARVVPLACVASFLLAWFVGDWTTPVGRFVSNLPLGFALTSFGFLFFLRMHEEVSRGLSVMLLFGLSLALALGAYASVMLVWPLIGDGPASVFHLCLMVLYLVVSAISAVARPAATSETVDGVGAREDAVQTIGSEHGLTAREAEVLSLLVQGRGAPYIAGELYVSVNTVKTHMKRIYQKVGVHSREELLDLVHGRA